MRRRCSAKYHTILSVPTRLHDTMRYSRYGIPCHSAIPCNAIVLHNAGAIHAPDAQYGTIPDDARRCDTLFHSAHNTDETARYFAKISTMCHDTDDTARDSRYDTIRYSPIAGAIRYDGTIARHGTDDTIRYDMLRGPARYDTITSHSGDI